MSDVIERIKHRIKESVYRIDDSATLSSRDVVGEEDIWDAFDEELAKEPRENSQARMIVESLPSLYNLQDFEEEAIEEILNNQPQVQPIVRTPEEVTEMLNKISCPECDKNSSHCHFSETECKNYWYEWLTKKEV